MLFDNLRPFWEGEESLQIEIQNALDRKYYVVLSTLYPNIEERPTDFQIQIGIKHFIKHFPAVSIDKIHERIKKQIAIKFPFVSFLGEPVREMNNDPEIVAEFGFRIRVEFGKIAGFYLPETYRLAALLLSGSAEKITDVGAYITMREMENFLIETGRKKLHEHNERSE